MKQTQNTRVVSGGRRGGSILAGGRKGGSVFADERKGSGSHSREWRGSGVLTGARERRRQQSLVLGRSGTEISRENTGTIAKQKQLPSAGLDSRPR